MKPRVLRNWIWLVPLAAVLWALLLSPLWAQVPSVTAVGEQFQDGNGWTQPVANGDVWYVSSSIGSDSYDGTSGTVDGGGVGPKETLAAAMALMSGGDHLLLKRGDTFPQYKFQPINGLDNDNPTVLNAYGTGDRPKIVYTTEQPLSISNDHRIYILNLHFDGSTRGPTDSPGGVGIQGESSSILIEGCWLDYLGSGLTIDPSFGEQRHQDITIRRNTISNSWKPAGEGHCQGIFADQTNRFLVEENILDHNGWHPEYAAPTAFNHNLYITHYMRDVVIRRNVISRGASSGLKFQPNDGTHFVTDNLFARNEIVGTVGGGQDSKQLPGIGAYIYWNNNVMMEAASTGRNVLGGMTSSNLDGGSFRSNILAHATDRTAQAYITNGYEGQGVGVNNFVFDGNVVYNWNGGVRFTANCNNMTFTNNTLEEPALLSVRSVAEVFTGADFLSIANNQYHSNAAAGTWFEINDVDATYAAFVAWTGETDSSNSQPSFTDDSWTVTDYVISLGYDDFATWIEVLQTQQQGSWNENIMASAINVQARAAYDVTAYSPVDTPPEVVGATVDTSGDVFTVQFNESVTNYAGFTLTASGGAVTLTPVSGTGTGTLVYSTSRTIAYDETLSLDYSQAAGNIVDGTANEVEDFSGFTVQNDSTDGESSDETAPTFVQASVEINGQSILVEYDEPITAADAVGWTATASGGSVALSFSGIDSGSLVLLCSRTIYRDETLTISYTNGSGTVEDLAGNAAGDISSAVVTNGSDVSRSIIIPGTITKP